MKRVQQHIIEEESRKSFAQLIPDGWVTNDFTKDYGKDIHLEIFRQNESTGNMFIAQLKGSSKKIIADTLCIQISTNSLKYYEDIDTPVLLVFYSTET